MRPPIRLAPLAMALALLAPPGLSAQDRAALRPSADDLEPAPAEPRLDSPVDLAPAGGDAARAGPRSTVAVAGAGLLGGAVGLVAGGYLGALLAESGDDEDLDYLGGAVVGAALGEGAMLPLGVHLADGRRGSYAASALVSLGLAGAGLLALEAVHYDVPGAPIVLVAVPVAQLVATIAVERATARGRGEP